MPFATIWTTSAKDVIRDIKIWDINGDKKSEVIYTSWDGNVYAVKGNSGTRVWISRPTVHEGPAENLLLLKLSNEDHSYIAVSRHKYLTIINGLDGKVEWTENLNSWISVMVREDFDQDGRHEVAAINRKGELYIIDDSGEIIYKKQIRDNKTLYSIVLSETKASSIPALAASRTHIEIMYGYWSDIYRELPLNTQIISLGSGRLYDDLCWGLVVGSREKIFLLNENLDITHKYRRKNLNPVLMKIGDVDGDFKDEIIIGDWNNDSIIILKVESDKLVKKKEIKLPSNPISIHTVDVNGNGLEEILVIIDKPAQNFLIINHKNSVMFSSDSYNISKGIQSGNALGFGPNDVVYRNGREKISLLIHVPRIFTPNIVKEKTEFSLNAITQASDSVQAHPLLEINSKKDEIQRVKLGIGWASMYSQKIRAKKCGSMWIRVQRKKRQVIKRPILVGSDHQLSTAIKAIYAYDEDVIKLPRNLYQNASIKTTSSYFTIKGFSTMHDRSHVSSILTGILRPRIIVSRSSAKEILQPLFVIDRAIELDYEKREYYTSKDSMTIIIRNKSSVPLKIRIIGGDIFKIPEKTLIVPPKSKKHVALGIIVDTSRYVEKIRSFIRTLYEGLQRHSLSISVDFTYINDEKIHNLATEILKLNKNLRDAINKIEETTGIPSNIIEKIIVQRTKKR